MRLMISDYHLSAINRCRLRRSPPIWYMVVAMVGQIVPVTYWWSCVAYSGLLKVAKSVTGSFFSRLGHLNPGSKSARAWVRSTSCLNQIQIVNFFDPCDLEIWRMTLKNDRAMNNFMTMRWDEQCEDDVTDRRTDGRMDRTVFRAA